MTIPLGQHLIALVFSISLLVVIVQLIRHRRLREEYALVWLIAGVVILVLSAFGGLVRLMASLVEVSYPPTLVLVVGLLFALVIILSQSVTISGQADRMRDLAQTVALLERRVRQVEQTSLSTRRIEPPNAADEPAE